MTAYHTVFQNRHAILPVIHVTDLDQALRNVHIAQDAGADGCFLINHSISWKELLPIYAKAKKAFPDFWIGLNMLDLDNITAMSLMMESDAGLWVDNAHIEEWQDAQPEADKVLRMREHRRWPGLYFGGVAFKHQRPVIDLAAAARRAIPYMDVVTTSGPATGKAADLTKIRTMKEALGDKPLAIASGVTPQNVTDYLPYVDCFLVATGISQTFEELDPGLTNLLVRTVRSYSDPA